MIMSAPARTIDVIASITTRFSSSQPFALAALIIAYSPLTQYEPTGTFTASFTSGVMYTFYGASVPAGWLVPLNYIQVGRPESITDDCSKVRLIVPHSQGHATASSNVTPYYYVITFERGT